MRSSIFLGFGRNETVQLRVEKFIGQTLGKTVIVLKDQPSHGLTVVEKLERAADSCAAAVMLMTKDDVVGDNEYRARQNVVHEIGYFQGKLGRHRVVLLAERGVNVFTNISGIVRVEFDAAYLDAAFEALRREFAIMNV